MFGSKLFTRKAGPPNHRKFERYVATGSEVLIGGKIYAMADWGHGGLRMTGRMHSFHPGQIVTMTLRFKTGERYIETRHEGDIVRTASEDIAVKFAEQPLPVVERCFQQVLDFRATRPATRK